MGHSTAEAVVRAGLTLVPYSLTGQSEAVAVGNVGIDGIPVELVGPAERQAALDKIRRCACCNQDSWHFCWCGRDSRVGGRDGLPRWLAG
jgi:hypothetical protein